MTGNPFFEVAVVLVVAAAAGTIAIRLRQPLILAFVAMGILLGPSGFDWVSARSEVDLLSQLGITLLLFVVGLKLDVQVVRHLGRVAATTGLLQVALMFLLGLPLVYALGLRGVPALYVAMALTFSSTVIVVKMLSDKREIDALHGRIAVGVLIVQDIVVIVLFAVLGTMEADIADRVDLPVWAAPLLLLAGVAAIGLLMRWVLPGLMHYLARSSELLLLFALAWGTMLAAAGDAVGLSKELGAFLGGFSLASTSYREALSARLTTLRDVLLLFFFVDLGARLSFESPGRAMGVAAVLSVFVLLVKPLLVMALTGLLGYRLRTGFFSGVTLAQISEFSLILTAVGISIGHVPEEVMGIVTLVGVFTITVSTYMILYSARLFPRFAGPLRFMERSSAAEIGEDARVGGDHAADAIVFGLGRLGSRLTERLLAAGFSVFGVDFDPEVVRSMRRKGCTVEYGDMADPGELHTLPLAQARWVVSTVPDRELNGALLRALHEEGFRGKVAVTAHTEHDAHRLTELGATKVFRPFADTATFAAEVVAADLSRDSDDG